MPQNLLTSGSLENRQACKISAKLKPVLGKVFTSWWLLGEDCRHGSRDDYRGSYRHLRNLFLHSQPNPDP